MLVVTCDLFGSGLSGETAELEISPCPKTLSAIYTRSKLCSPSSAMVTFPYKQSILVTLKGENKNSKKAEELELF